MVAGFVARSEDSYFFARINNFKVTYVNKDESNCYLTESLNEEKRTQVKFARKIKVVSNLTTVEPTMFSPKL